MTAAETTTGRFPDGSFLAYWSAVGVSQFGSAVSMMAIPLIAAVTLRFSAGQMAWLTAFEILPALLVRVPAAAWSDRLRGRLLPMIGCNVVQAAIMGAIPLLWWQGRLSFPALLFLVAAASLALGVSTSLSPPLLVRIVPKEHLVDANGKTSATRSVADISGPAAAGALMAVLAAPLVVLVDAASFLLSALLLLRVRVPHEPGGAGEGRARGTAGDIPRLARDLVRRSGVQAMVALSFVQGVVQPILVLFMADELELGKTAIGLLTSLGAVGGVGAGLLVGRVLGRYGPGRTVALGTVASVCSLAVLPFAGPGFSGAASVVVFELASSFGGTIMAATVFGTLQGTAPEGKVARVMALAGTSLQIGALAGISAGGALAELAGLRTAVGVAALLMPLVLLPQVVRRRPARWETV
ncbi:MFS transporter [Streptosporangium sp. NPDC051022]|uniref:MFS transporter n=1 Tax=Streptosporangium sp. NPDC051022 TaxID=3155752 RepID=UPI003441B601